MTRVWVVRAGSQGSLIELVQRESVVVIGWGELGDLAAIPDQETLRARVDEIYAGDSGASLSKHFSQTRAFRFDMEQGDLVIAPGPQGRDLLVGRVVGDCEYRPRLPPEAQQVRPVEWLGSFRRHDVKEDLQNTLGSLLTVFEVKQAGASDRFLAVIAGGSDPGSLVGETTEKRQAPLKRLRRRGDRDWWSACRSGDVGVDEHQPCVRCLDDQVQRPVEDHSLREAGTGGLPRPGRDVGCH